MAPLYKIVVLLTIKMLFLMGKITISTKDTGRGKSSMSRMDLGQFLESIKTDSRSGYVARFRETMPYIVGHPERFNYIDRIPRICVGAEYMKRPDGEVVFCAYNGWLLLEADGLSNAVEVETVKREAAVLPQTLDVSCSCLPIGSEILHAFAQLFADSGSASVGCIISPDGGCHPLRQPEGDAFGAGTTLCHAY